jgi:YVTN family beta-propeller protein
LRDGRPITLGAARQRLLLATLLARPNEAVSSDRLIDELWAERPPETAATALHGFVSQLRKALEPERPAGSAGTVLVTQPPGYLLRVPRGALDAERFEELRRDGRNALDEGDPEGAAKLLREALALWRGSAFAGLEPTGEAHAEARRLEELRLEALEDRLEADLALGRDGTLVAELEGLVDREPLRERPRAQLMLALYRAGRQADALELYQETRRRFVRELGIEPTPRLRELEQAILTHDPELDAGLPRWRPRARLRRRPARNMVALAASGLAAVAAAVVVLLAREDGAAPSVHPGSVAIVDAATTRVVDTVDVGSGPAAIAFGHGAVWVANAEDDTVSRIDPETREVDAVIGVPSPVDLAVGADAIWIAGGIDGTVSRIDPESNDVVAKIDLRGSDPLVPRTVQGIAAGANGVWAALAGHEIVRIDPATNDVVRSTDIRDVPVALATGYGSVWVLTAPGRLLRIEPRSGSVTADSAAVPPGGFLNDVTTTDDGVLVLHGDVSLFDPASARLRRTLSSGQPVAAIADERGSGLWAATYEGVVTHMDTGAAEPPRTVRVGAEPSAMVEVGPAVWVAVREPEPF